jgi:hypothetical protein
MLGRMSRYTSRPYRGTADLRRVQNALPAAQGSTWWHVGDLAWAVAVAFRAMLFRATR